MPRKQKLKNPPPNSNSTTDSHPNTATPAVLNTQTPKETLSASSLVSSIPAFQTSPLASLSQTDLINLGQALATSATSAPLLSSSTQGVLAFTSPTPPAILNPAFLTTLGTQPTVISPITSMSQVTVAKRGRGRPKKSESEKISDIEKKSEIDASEEKSSAAQASWFVEGADGYSDMDIVALWCAKLDNFDRWKSCTPRKIAVAALLSEHMAQKNQPGRNARECNKKIGWLETKFKKAWEQVQSTGQGILDNEDYKNKLKELDLLSVTVNSDGEEQLNGKIYRKTLKQGRSRAPPRGSPLEKALGICPWYCILESVMLERSNIIPEATHETLANTPLTPLDFKEIDKQFSSEESKNEDGNSINNLVPSDLEEQEEKAKVKDVMNKKGVTPHRMNKKARQDSRNSSASQDPLGLQNLITNILPSKAERLALAKEEHKKEKEQSKLTSKIADAITVMLHNRKEDLQLKKAQLRSEAATKFISMGDTFEDAFRKASILFPDCQPAQTQEVIQGSSKDLGLQNDEIHDDSEDSTYGGGSPQL